MVTPQNFKGIKSRLVEKAVGILETEPIDIHVNPTFLPAAIEINARYRIPSEAFLRLARSKGAKFTFGTNNAGANDLGDWSYPLDMQKKLGLEWQDMFVPGHQPSRALRE